MLRSNLKMSTANLARLHGAVQHVSVTNQAEIQPFAYLLVLDFEATCWENKGGYQMNNEIIEFPVVIYDVKNDKIIDEFQMYVRPTENPQLSPFCTHLTGIRQEQVQNALPIFDCLKHFAHWLSSKMKEYKMRFEEKSKNRCAFATWSDWDLGVCLRRECARKRIKFMHIFNYRIDIRKKYISYYKTYPFGLSGALHNVGLTFEGQEHCGLHDARNTARLVGKMLESGAVLQFT